MTFDEIKKEYINFIEYLSLANTLINEITPALNKFLQIYCKTKDFDYTFARALEVNLLYFENFSFLLNEVMEYVENTSFKELELPNVKNTQTDDWQKVALFIPKDFDTDLYVEEGECVDLNILKKEISNLILFKDRDDKDGC